jgi:sec-independent protein translocase protein TatA
MGTDMGDALAPWHIVILLIVFMVLFGAKRLPGAAQSLGQALKIFKHETKNLSHEDGNTPTAAPFATSTVVTPPQTAQPPLPQQQQIEQLQRQLNDLQAKTAADADGATVNGVPLSEAQRNQPG